jgi:hypothetical protein
MAAAARPGSTAAAAAHPASTTTMVPWIDNDDGLELKAAARSILDAATATRVGFGCVPSPLDPDGLGRQ